MTQRAASDLPILIIGGGVAGLTLAQGLRLHSIPFRLFERQPLTRSSQGHRFRISKDGKAALDSVLSPQLQELLKQTAADSYPFEPRHVDAKKLDYAKPPPGDPDTMPVDRTWFRLLTTLDISDAIEYEKDFESYQILDEDEGVQVKFKDGSVACGRLLVGADGVKSRIRKQLQPDRRLLDVERWVTWGRAPLTEELRKTVPQDLLSWCMYIDQEANVQLIVEPMTWSKCVRKETKTRLPDFDDYIYWVVCTAPFQYSDNLPKTATEKKQFLDKASETWHPALRYLLDSAVYDLSTCIPVLSSKPDIEIRLVSQNARGRVTLIGDAVHSMSPMGGVGGDTAIRNAADLARTVAGGITKGSIAEFEGRMETLAREKIEHSFRSGQRFWRGKAWPEYNEVDV
ncbi:FAD/NAD(P)-binding domain-containing protein [Hypoxylon sp. FL1857]|nr:FAD/NAD(P)-binding domain-containing protein [Hypoxylon sp. FL1857]